MTRSQLQSAVIQYTILISLSMITFHEMGRDAYDDVWKDPVVKNLTSTFSAISRNATTSKTTGYNTTSHNITITRSSTVSSGSSSDPTTDFYTSALPRNIFVYALICPLTYYWHIWLERFFPTRPRGVTVNYEGKEKADIEDNEDQEEEVVKRRIAQGKVRRSSVSWWNTFVKWILHYTVHTLWFGVLSHFVEGCMKWNSFSTILGSIWSVVFERFLTSFLSIGPLASLIGFVIVPAQKRLMFETCVDVLEAVFKSALFRLVIPWAVHTEFAQQFMANVTEELVTGQIRGAPGMNGRLIDEL